MKTTLTLPPQLMSRVKREAARRGTTMSALVEAALRAFLDQKQPAPEAGALPVFRMGRAAVDVSDRDALHDVLDDRP